MIVTRGKVYERCGDCGKIVRLNKPIGGSIHLCVTNEEREAIKRAGITFTPLDNTKDEGR